MRFALLGNHTNGMAMARALVLSGRHLLVAAAGISSTWEQKENFLLTYGEGPKLYKEIEEVLADPAVEAVVVASRIIDRAFHLRRALQSERHILCVHPADTSPDIGYEAALIQGDTQKVLFPLLTEFLHPGVLKLAEMVRKPDSPIGRLHLIELDRWYPETNFLKGPGKKLSLPGWDILRSLKGEISEVSALTFGKEQLPNEPITLNGRFEQGGLFQVSLMPNQKIGRGRLTLTGSQGRASLSFPNGWFGLAHLEWANQGEVNAETWETWDPWPHLVDIFESAIEANRRKSYPGRRPPPQPRWQDAVRSLELDDAARRSLEHHRVSLLEYQEPSEETGFKGTMTLAGCGLLWSMLLLLIMAHWVPALGWVFLPLLGGFLLLQLLGWVLPTSKEEPSRGVRIEDQRSQVTE